MSGTPTAKEAANPMRGAPKQSHCEIGTGLDVAGAAAILVRKTPPTPMRRGPPWLESNGLPGLHAGDPEWLQSYGGTIPNALGAPETPLRNPRTMRPGAQWHQSDG